jgi:hypothetical protein
MVHHEFSEEGRKARFEQWEKYGADRLKNDLQTDPYRRVHRRRRRASSRRASRPKSSSQVTLCWRKPDSNSRSRSVRGRLRFPFAADYFSLPGNQAEATSGVLRTLVVSRGTESSKPASSVLRLCWRRSSTRRDR